MEPGDYRTETELLIDALHRLTKTVQDSAAGSLAEAGRGADTAAMHLEDHTHLLAEILEAVTRIDLHVDGLAALAPAAGGAADEKTQTAELVGIKDLLEKHLPNIGKGGSASGGRQSGAVRPRRSGRMARLFDWLGKKTQGTRAGKIAGPLVQRFGSGGAGAGGVAAPITGIVAFWTALYQVGEAGKKLAYEQLELSRKLAQVSPSQAAIVAGLDTNRVFRDLERGEATKQTSRRNADAVDQWERAMMPIQIAVDNLKNTVGAFITERFANWLSNMEQLGIEILKKVGANDAAKQWENALKDRAELPNLAGQDLQQMFEREQRKVRDARAKIRGAMDAGRP
jgi:hypothetical protein